MWHKHNYLIKLRCLRYMKYSTNKVCTLHTPTIGMLTLVNQLKGEPKIPQIKLINNVNGERGTKILTKLREIRKLREKKKKKKKVARAMNSGNKPFKSRFIIFFLLC